MKFKERQQVMWVREQASQIVALVEAGRFTEAISRARGIGSTTRTMLEAGSHLTPTARRCRKNMEVLSGGAPLRGNGG